MTLTLAPNGFEVQTPYDRDRRISFDGPGIDGVQCHFREAELENLGRGARGVSTASVSFVTEDEPKRGGSERMIDASQSHDTDRCAVVRKKNSDHMTPAPGDGLHPRWRHRFLHISKVEPLRVFLLAQPRRHLLDNFIGVNGVPLDADFSFESTWATCETEWLG